LHEGLSHHYGDLPELDDGTGDGRPWPSNFCSGQPCAPAAPRAAARTRDPLPAAGVAAARAPLPAAGVSAARACALSHAAAARSRSCAYAVSTATTVSAADYVRGRESDELRVVGEQYFR
jgi:hypothetical protein